MVAIMSNFIWNQNKILGVQEDCFILYISVYKEDFSEHLNVLLYLINDWQKEENLAKSVNIWFPSLTHSMWPYGRGKIAEQQ